MNQDKGAWHDGLAYTLCLAAPWSLIWLDSNTLFPYTSSKAWVFRSLVELAFALSLTTCLSSSRVASLTRVRPAGSRTLLMVLSVFFAWSVVTAITGIDFYRSVWSNWERMGGLIDYLHWAIYLASLLIVIDRLRVRGMLLNLVAVIVVVCLISFLGREMPSYSTLGNPIYLGNLAVFGLFITGFLLAGSKGGKTKPRVQLLFLLIAIPVLFAALISSASRGSMIAFAFAVLVVLGSFGLKFALRYGKTGASGLIVVVLIFLGALLPQLDVLQRGFRNSDTYALQRLGQISLDDQTTIDRLENWNIALDAGLSRPWLGWGQENYMIAFNLYYRPGEIDKAKLWFDRAHNAYLDVLVAFGLPGLLLYLLLMALPVLIVWRDPYWSWSEKTMLVGFFSAFVVKNVSGFDTFSSTLIWISVLALVVSISRDSPEFRLENKQYNGFNSLRSSLVLVPLALVSIIFINMKDYQENRAYAELLSVSKASNSEALENVLDHSTRSLKYAQNSKLAVFDTILTSAQTPEYGTPEEAKQRQQQVFQRAGKLIQQALIQQPKNFRIKYNGAALLSKLGQHALALQLFKELTQAAPKRTAFWHALVNAYAAAGMDEAAQAAYKTAINLNPDWKP